MKRHISEIDHERLTAEIANLAGLGNDELKARWKAAYGTAAPLRMKRDLLRYAVAYRMQERALGGVKPAICRLLDRLADDAAARRLNSVNASTIEAIGGFRRSGILSGPSAGAIFNNTEDPFNPQSGEIISLLGNLSDQSFGADYRYWRVLAEARKYHLLGWQTVLATRLKVGLSDTLGSIGDVPLSERFYSGGEASVRGYGLRRIGPLSLSNDPLGGLSLIEGSVELRRPLFWKLNGALFFDCGQVATQPYDLRVDALQCGYGPAAGMNSPVGPINFYLGFPTQKPRGDSSWQFYFSVGQYF